MKRTRQINFLLLIIIFTLFNILSLTLTVSATNTDDWPIAPEIVGEAAIIIEPETGVVLYEKNSNATMYPASLTKLTTALLVLENCKLDEMVYFSSNAVFSLPAGSSHIAINPGEYLSVEHCLYGLLLPSANEVANALAEHVSGSIDDFATLMNSRMKELGALNTHFTNPTGLHDDEHYTTCYDMATLCRILLQNKTFLKIDGTSSYVIPSTNLQPLKRPINTTHKLLRRGSTNYAGAFGGKTGHTDEAGNTLITFAERNGVTLICVVMKSDANNIYSDTTALLDYAFSYFKKLNIAEVETSFDFTHNILNNKNPNPTLSLSENSYVYIPVTAEFDDLEYTLIPEENKANVFAKLRYTYNEHYVGEAYLLTNPSEYSITTENLPSDSEEEIPVKIVEILPIHIIIFISGLILTIAWIIYLKLTRVQRIRRKQIRFRKRLQRKKQLH